VAVELAGLLVANLAYLLVGVAAFVAAGWVRLDQPSTWRRLGAAYLFGLVLVVVPASYLSLLAVPVGLGAFLVGLLVVALAVRRLWPLHTVRVAAAHAPSLSLEGAVAAGVTACALVLLAYGTRTFVTRPLLEYDAWAIWATKARLLYENASAAPGVLRSGRYGQSPYPLGLPTLEALGFGAMGKFDGTVIGGQFVALAFGFVFALWSLLVDVVRPLAIALATVALVSAQHILFQLLTHYADVPLGLFVGLGVAAAAAWTLRPTDDRWLLACSVAFLGMAGLTKSEGVLFAAAAMAALLVSQAGRDWRSRMPQALGATGALVAVLLPWRVYCAAYSLSTSDYDLRNITNVTYLREHEDRLHPVIHELWRQVTAGDKWGLVVPAVGLAVLSALLARRWRVATFAVVWLLLAFVGLVLVYWVSTLPTANNLTNSSFRTMVSLVIGGGVLVPLLIAPRPPRHGAPDA
jgi:hypothetical protein